MCQKVTPPPSHRPVPTAPPHPRTPHRGWIWPGGCGRPLTARRRGVRARGHACVSVHARPPPPRHTRAPVGDTLRLLAPGLALSPVTPGGAPAVPCHRRCPGPRRRRWICPGCVPRSRYRPARVWVLWSVLQGLGQEQLWGGGGVGGLLTPPPWSFGASKGGSTEPRSLWAVTLGPEVLGSSLEPWGVGGPPQRESAGRRGGLSLPCRGGRASGLSFPTCMGSVFWLRLSPSVPAAVGSRSLLPMGSTAPQGCLSPRSPSLGPGEVGRWAGDRWCWWCLQPPALVRPPGSPVPARAEPNHCPDPVLVLSHPNTPPGGAGGGSNPPGGAVVSGGQPPVLPPPPSGTPPGGCGHVGSCDAGICPSGSGWATGALCHQQEPETPPAPSWGVPSAGTAASPILSTSLAAPPTSPTVQPGGVLSTHRLRRQSHALTLPTRVP